MFSGGTDVMSRTQYQPTGGGDPKQNYLQWQIFRPNLSDGKTDVSLSRFEQFNS